MYLDRKDKRGVCCRRPCIRDVEMISMYVVGVGRRRELQRGGNKYELSVMLYDRL